METFILEIPHSPYFMPTYDSCNSRIQYFLLTKSHDDLKYNIRNIGDEKSQRVGQTQIKYLKFKWYRVSQKWNLGKFRFGIICDVQGVPENAPMFQDFAQHGIIFWDTMYDNNKWMISWQQILNTVN